MYMCLVIYLVGIGIKGFVVPFYCRIKGFVNTWQGMSNPSHRAALTPPCEICRTTQEAWVCLNCYHVSEWESCNLGMARSCTNC